MNRVEKQPGRPRLQFKPNWKIVVFCLLLLPLLIGLGLWQLERAEEKTTIQESWREQQALPAVPIHELAGDSQADFRRVSVTGQFDENHYWLLENRMLDGQLGYEVIMPFIHTSNGSPRVLLVNRGWQPAGAYRTELPEFETPEGTVRITGSLSSPSDNRLIQETDNQPLWPGRLLEIDVAAMAAQLKQAGQPGDLHRQVLQIDAESRAAFHTNWQPINMSPATHHGYAVQWFSLALALVILTIFANSNLAQVLFKRK